MRLRPKRWRKIVMILAMLAGIGIVHHDYGIYCRARACDWTTNVKQSFFAGKNGSIAGVSRRASDNRSRLLEQTILLKYIIH